MHGLGIIHRDIKGANILLDSKGDVKIGNILFLTPKAPASESIFVENIHNSIILFD